MQETFWKSLTTRKVMLSAFGAFVLAIGVLWVIDPDAFPIKGPTTQADTPPVETGPRLSPAERIGRLQASLDANRVYLDKLKKELDDPNSEYKRAERRFQPVDEELQNEVKAIQQLKDTGKAQEAMARAGALKELQTRWQQNRDRFDLAIKERKALQANIAGLNRKIKEDQRALDRMSSSGADPSADSATADAKPSGNSDKPAAKADAKSEPAANATSSLPIPGLPFKRPAANSDAKSSTDAKSTASADAKTPPTGPAAREVERARAEAKLKEEAAKKAENRAQSITQRLESLRQSIGLAEKLLANARQRADHEQQTKNALEAELKQKTAANAPKAERDALTDGIQRAQRRFQTALADVASATDHLHGLQNELNGLQAAQIRALRDADSKKHDAEAAEERIAQLQNPFRPRNIIHWLFQHGPRLVLIVVGMLIFSRLSRVFSHRLVALMARGDAGKRGTRKDRENRSQTLVGVFSSALSLLVLGGGTLMILDEVGIPIVPLMGGAAVLGLAVAFGAQNLIKDYFSGFMVLLEDQYGINDVVRIGPISGLVEHISLRTTVLRDLEGVVHFVPHGTITTVSNLTHGWSRALFDVGVAYKEDVDRVMQILLEMGREIRQDATFGPLILDDPEMLGVDNLADSSVVIKFFLKTLPLQQWTVKREMLRRIKNRFDELGIEIPFPHQTVYHRFDGTSPNSVPLPPFAVPPAKRAG